MHFKEFIDEVKNSVKEYLPEKYQDAQIIVQEQRKINEQYIGLLVVQKDQKIAPAIDMNRMYESFLDGISVEDILEQISDMVQKEPNDIDIDKLVNYEEAKKNLFIRVSSAEQNRKMLENVPHKIVEDLAITYHVKVMAYRDNIASSMVTNAILDSYGVTPEQLYADAVENSPKNLPLQIEPMGAMMKRLMLDDMKASGMSQEEIDAASMMADEMFEGNPMIIVTNDYKVNGAASIFYPEVMDQLGEKMGGDYFILPSSIHETLVVPDNGELDFHDLRDMVKEINASQVLPEERLTDEVYHYDANDKVFEKASTFEERQKTKAAEKNMGEKTAEKAQEIINPKHRSSEMSL